MTRSLDEAELDAILGPVSAPPTLPATHRPVRQPVHTVYGGAHLFTANSAHKLGRLALVALERWAGDSLTFARALGMAGAQELPTQPAAVAALHAEFTRDAASLRRSQPAAWLAETVYQRVREKLAREPVEDFRIDFEDGYGHRPDAEEDAHAEAAAHAVAQGLAENSLPPFLGIRIKALDAATGRRAARTLDRFLQTLLAASDQRLPPGFVVTLPKVGREAEVRALVALLEAIEARSGLEAGSLHIELMVETAGALIGIEGRFALPALVEAGCGRVVGAHFGVYDYTAEMGLTAGEQRLDHPACDLARGLMQIALAGTGVHSSDGATNILPVPSTPDTGDAEAARLRRHEVHAGWRRHFQHARRSLARGLYQGWDLHPAQLPSRYAAVFSFFLEDLEVMTYRLRCFVEKAARATLSGDVFDDAATGQGLLNLFLRGLACGAVTGAEAEATGLTLDELHSRSFQRILAIRAADAARTP